MSNENFKRAIYEALTQEYENSIPISEDHIFSVNFEKKMSKLIRQRRKPYYKMVNTFGKRAACLSIGVVLAFSVTITNAEAIQNVFGNFFINTFEKFSIIQSAKIDKTPQVIEDDYIITYDLSIYTSDLWFSDANCRSTEYINNEKYIIFEQYTKNAFDIHLNTEDADIEELKIDNFDAVYYMDNHNYNNLIWDNGEYVFFLHSNISKNELINIAKSVQKVEK